MRGGRRSTILRSHPVLGRLIPDLRRWMRERYDVQPARQLDVLLRAELVAEHHGHRIVEPFDAVRHAANAVTPHCPGAAITRSSPHASGNVYVADTGNNRVQKFDASGTILTAWGSSGSANGQFHVPGGVASDGAGTSTSRR